MMIYKITPYIRAKLVDERLNTQPYKPTNQNSLKSPKLLSQLIRTRYYSTLGTNVINSKLSPPSLYYFNYYLRFEM